MNKNNIVLVGRNVWFSLFRIMGSGINRTISMSNTRKISASKKNRMENGIRADRVGSNPHSKGDIFSRLFIDVRMDRIHDKMNRIGGIIMVIEEAVKDKFIYQKF
jgi:hypothetical protein